MPRPSHSPWFDLSGKSHKKEKTDVLDNGGGRGQEEEEQQQQEIVLSMKIEERLVEMTNRGMGYEGVSKSFRIGRLER